MTKYVFHILNGDGDLYEVAQEGKLITRVTVYRHGSQAAVEIKNWDDLAPEIQGQIELKAREIMNVCPEN